MLSIIGHGGYSCRVFVFPPWPICEGWPFHHTIRGYDGRHVGISALRHRQHWVVYWNENYFCFFLKKNPLSKNNFQEKVLKTTSIIKQFLYLF